MGTSARRIEADAYISRGRELRGKTLRKADAKTTPANQVRNPRSDTVLTYAWQGAEGPCVSGTAWPRYAKSFVDRVLIGSREDAHLLAANSALVVSTRFETSPIGFLRYTVRDGVVNAAGTWVRTKYRRLGLGAELWRRMIEHECPTEIWVAPITRGSSSLVRGMARAYPGVRWMIWPKDL